MVIDFNRPNGSPSTNNAGRSNAAQTNEQTSGLKSNSQTNPTAAQQVSTEIKDSVQLSPVAQQLQNISDKLKDTPSVDKERVAKLKQAVADGTYAPDSARVAEKLLKLEFQS